MVRALYRRRKICYNGVIELKNGCSDGWNSRFTFFRATHTKQHMKRLFSTIFLFSVLVLVPTRMVSASGSLSPWAEEAVKLMNQDRADRGIPELSVNDLLAKAAQAKLTDMEEKDYFSHTSPEKRTPWSFVDEVGYDYRFAGENLAIHFKNPESEHQAWMKSEKHCQNILDPRFREVGVAVGKAFFEGRETIIAVSMFGTKTGEETDPSASKEMALALCRGDAPVVYGAASEESLRSPEGRVALFMRWISGKSGTINTFSELLASSPYDEAVLFAIAMFAGAQLSAIVIAFGLVLSREQREGLFPS